ncbi:Ferredoxin subunit of nitrite reductase or a ring-hydroxylating dioxygenase [Asanoa hainanensis]|uniref:Ferredoxin subunit of nitrite reductase or a ring-hydroxylating dioxygenase n=1 Tax=Asanoa hainanensis TaxID=560556 RepID=A0A239P5S4_9ACTN|nr:Rieske (2Fe-2S) protein [Asanoa hainanensis]SNT62446.1 Ferredoxin subunit of nitrite reductase or a ring-hydroxylating dioxygenase [Asanoa hainanensis]
MSREEAVTSRRTLLAGVGAVGAVSVLAACGSDDPAGSGAATNGGSNPEPTDQAEEPSGDTGGGEVVGKVADVPVGGGAIFAATEMVVTQPTAGQFHGFRAVCTHQGCPIASVDSGTINCSCHGSKFSLDTGEPRNGPATRALTERQVTVKGDDIVLA